MDEKRFNLMAQVFATESRRVPGSVTPAPRSHLDYATWHARLAGRNGPVAPAPTRSGRRVPLDLETWRAHLAGSEQRAA
jgi:hypothetical protein